MHTLKSQEHRYQKETLAFTEIPQDMDAINLFFSQINPLPSTKRLLCLENDTLPTKQIINLQIFGQNKLVITGRNGIGKTRLLQRILAKLKQNRHLSIGYMPQNAEEVLIPEQTPLSFLAEVAPEGRCRTLLASLRFTRQEIEHSVVDLSGGQKAKLFLAKMVLAGNNILVLDEPTRHFSPTSQPLIRELFANFPGCIISVSHDRAFIEEVGKIHYTLTDTQLIRVH